MKETFGADLIISFQIWDKHKVKILSSGEFLY